MEWKEPFAWTILFAYIIFVCGSVLLYYMHMDRYPIQRSNRSFVLLCCTALGSAVALTVPGEDINPHGLTCRMHYMLFGVMLPLFFLPALMNYLRYVVKCESQALISSLANACSNGRVQRSHTLDQLPAPHLSFSSQVDQSKSIQDHLLMIQKRTTTRTLLQVSGAFVALYVLARAMINYSIRYARKGCNLCDAILRCFDIDDTAPRSLPLRMFATAATRLAWVPISAKPFLVV
jgi:hypothetical protein